MPVGFARPDVSQLMFHLFARSVHPELFCSCVDLSVDKPRFSVSLRVCESGHLMTFRTEDHCLTEVMSTHDHPLPQRKRLFAKRLRGSRDESIRLNELLEYHVSFQLEQLAPEVFLHVHEELLLDCESADIGRRFPSANRLAPEPLSFMQTDISSRSVLVHCFHTFPENCAVVKTQSLVEFRG